MLVTVLVCSSSSVTVVWYRNFKFKYNIYNLIKDKFNFLVLLLLCIYYL